MAVGLNSEFNYRTQVVGLTPWAKIQNLQGFLEGRVRAAALEEVSALKLRALRSEIAHAIETDQPEHVVLRLQADLLEHESHLPAQTEAFALNHVEIDILRRLISEQYVMAEPSRIEGYSDAQMFEANAEYEFTVWLAREIQAELIATGHASPMKIGNAMCSPRVFAALVHAGLIPEGNVPITFSTEALELLRGDGCQLGLLEDKRQ